MRIYDILKGYTTERIKLFTMEFAKLERMLMEADKNGIKEMMRHSTKRRALFDK